MDTLLRLARNPAILSALLTTAPSSPSIELARWSSQAARVNAQTSADRF